MAKNLMVKIRLVVVNSQSHGYSDVIFAMCVSTDTYFSDVTSHRLVRLLKENICTSHLQCATC